MVNGRSFAAALVLALTFTATACGPRTPSEPDPEAESVAPPEAAAASTTPDSLPQGLLLALAVLEKGPDGKPLPQPAELGMLIRAGGEWRYRVLTDGDSNVFHKALVYERAAGDAGILTLGGTRAIVKLHRVDGEPEVLWEADFGGKFSRIRDAEVGDLFGEGTADIAVATHDQGVVALIRPLAGGTITVEELDSQKDTFVHEIEIGDLDGDGIPEVYATPSAPNKLDGTPQPGQVVRYVPGKGEGRLVVADLGDRHAKEILVADLDGDDRDELYVSVEAVAGGKVKIVRYDADTDPKAGIPIAEIDDTLCRFLTAGDVDGDGDQEMVAAAYKSGLWLLEPGDPWSVRSIDRDSSGFEHAAILTDLDGDGRDELYVASDAHKEVRRYLWVDGDPRRETIYQADARRSRFTWNIMPAPVDLLP